MCGGEGDEEDKSEELKNPDYGLPAEYDSDFHGPIKNRGCTDIICCILFMAVILGYLVVGILAWIYGDPRHVLNPKNSTGWFCGVGENKNRPTLFYFDILKCALSFNTMALALNGAQCPTTQVCVEKCPSEFGAVRPMQYLPSVAPASVFDQKMCVPSINLQTTNLTVKQIVEMELCPFFYFPTTNVMGRCLPNVSGLNNIPSYFTNIPGLPTSNNETIKTIKDGSGDIVNGLSAKDIGVQIFEDFALSWMWILFCLLIAMVVSLLFLLLLRFFARIIVWLLIIGVLAAGAYGIWHCYWEYRISKEASATIADVGVTINLKAYLQVQETWLAFLIILSLVEAVMILMLIFLRKRILIAIALIEESSRAVSYMMPTLLFPIVTFVLLLVCVAYWGVTALYLATSGEPTYRVVALNSSVAGCGDINGTEACNPQNFTASNHPTCPLTRCIFIKYNEEGLFQRNLFNLQIYNAFAFLWCANFVIALGQCTLAGAFASYYWSFEKPDDIPMNPVCNSFKRTLRYHVGSLAFGSLILTLIEILKAILEYIDHRTKMADNRVARFIVCCLKCCFWCLEKFLKFLTKNAYIMMAIYGKNFCASAKKAFQLLMRNIIRVVVLDKVTGLLLLFGKLLVVGGVGVLSFFFFSGRINLPGSEFRSDSLNYYWMPIITVGFGSYLIATGFFNVYSMCVDTLFLCFLEDLERNDGSVERPYFMSKNLMRILSKTNEGSKESRSSKSRSK